MTKASMTLADCCIPLIAYIRQFQREPAGDADTVAQRIDQLIAETRRVGRERGFSDAAVQAALFAVVAWADEVLLAAHWSGAGDWPRRLLQKRYFNVTNAGVAFFTRLDALTAQQRQVREVYFLCLSLGFAGRYAYERNPKALDDIKRHNLKVLLQDIRRPAGGDLQMLFPEGYADGRAADEPKDEERRLRWGFSSLTLSAVLTPLLLLAVLYTVYHVIIWKMVDDLLPLVK